MDAIVVRGAREHNLKNLHLEIPRNRLVVITGVSGSGKSSLAFDTLFAEGQRRYVESLSAYARQFLPQVEKPDVDAIDGLSPAISIEQKSVSRNPRSTVGTVTEIHDYLRLLFASIGIPHCPSCGQEIRPQTVQQMVDRLRGLPEGTRLLLYAPYVRGKKGEYKKQLAEMARQGFLRARIDGETFDLSKEIPALDKQKKHAIDILVDRLVVKPGLDKRARRFARDGAQGRQRPGRRGAGRPAGGDAVAELLLCDLRHQPVRDHAAPVLVQQPLRRLPDLFRSRHAHGGRPGKGRARSRALDRRRRPVALPAGLEVVAPAHDRDPGEGDGLLAAHALEPAARPRPGRSSCRAAASRSSSSSSRARSRATSGRASTRASCRCSSGATASPSPRSCAARSRSSCRCDSALTARVGGCAPRRWRSPSPATRSTS